jgi:diguanylate cyclase (GGDEF)-like protein
MPESIQKSIQRAMEQPDREQRLAALLELAPWVAAEAPAEAGDLADPLHRLGLELDDQRAQACSLWLRGLHRLTRFQFHEARTALESALEAARRLKDEALILNALLALTECLFRRNLYNDALQHANEGIGLARSMGDRRSEGVMRCWAGAVQVQMSMYQEALEELHHAREILVREDAKVAVAQTLNYMAIVHEELGDAGQAVANYQRALDILQVNEDLPLKGKVLANLGEAILNTGDTERALPILEEALGVLDRVGDHSLKGWALWAIGRVHMEDDRDDLAMSFYQRSMEEVELGGAVRTRAECLTGMGELYAKQGDRDRAINALREALDLAREAHVIREIYKIHEVMAQVHEQFGEHESALQHYKAFSAVRGAVWDEVAKAKIGSISARFELEKVRHEQEIAQLRNVELKGAYDKLRDLNSQLEDKAAELAELSIRDSLTDVYNRRHLDRQLAIEFERSRRYDNPLTFALMDLDNFKSINDGFSHAVGDEVLRRTSTIIDSAIRQSDLFARYGGEEFALVFPDTSAEAAAQACEKICRAIERWEWGGIHADLKVTISIGLAEASEVSDWEKLTARADERLYKAKRAGKNQVVTTK